MIKRVYDDLNKLLKPQKALVIYGPRRVGKTTLLQGFLAKTKLKYKLDSGDNIRTQEILGSQDFSQILPYIEGYDLIAVDEAQQIPNIGMGLKIILDQSPKTAVVATGSSSFDLAGSIGEPLTGRKRTITLYPIWQKELLSIYNKFELKEKLEDFLVFGSYPEVVSSKTKQDKIIVLQEIVNSYLLKDILSLDRVKGSKIIFNLLKMLAFQIGNQVSLNELSNNLGLDVKTVGRYIDLLEKSFVIISVAGFSRNLRSEIKSKNKYYFLDNGIRNAVVSQLNPINLRNDVGQLWENFVFIERLKKRAYKNVYGGYYFWRTYEQQEIDLIEEREGRLFGYEFKWSEKKKIRSPKNWLENYPNALFTNITPINYFDFII